LSLIKLSNPFVSGNKYENNNLHTSKEVGRYYTPKNIIDYMVENTLSIILRNTNNFKEILNIKILDPAMGHGYFLYECSLFITNYVFDNFTQDKNIDKEDIFKQIILNCIYGVDLDKKAISGFLNLFENNLTEYEYKLLKSHIICGDSILDNKKIAKKWNNISFDLIIGNPPYISDNKILDIYKNIGFKYAKGQFDIFWLFYENAFNGQLKENGFHAFIIPDGFLIRDKSSELRRELVTYNKIKSITICNPRLFKNAKISNIILIWQKKMPNNLDTINIYDFKGSLDLINCVNQFDLLKDKECKFLFENKDSSSHNLENKSYSIISDYFDISRGEEYGKKDLIKSDSLDEDYTPIITGEDIKKSTKLTTKYFIHSSLLKKKKTNYLSPKIVLCKTGVGINAALDLDNYVTLQSVYNLRLKKEVTEKLSKNEIYKLYEFFIEYLNSNIINEYIKNNFTKYKKVFPQLNQSTIKSIPILKEL